MADWMFGSTPEFVVGVGGLNFIKDGRNIYDNIQLIYQYPKGQKLIYSVHHHQPAPVPVRRHPQ